MLMRVSVIDAGEARYPGPRVTEQRFVDLPSSDVAVQIDGAMTTRLLHVLRFKSIACVRCHWILEMN